MIDLVRKHGYNWTLIASQIEGRTGKQIRERFINKLDPRINRSKFTEDEDSLILKRWREVGPKWQKISKEFNGRSENMIKNRFYSHLKKKLLPTQKTQKVCNEMSIETTEKEVQNNDEGFNHNEPAHSGNIPQEKTFKENEFFLPSFSDEEDLRTVQQHYEYLKRKKELLESTLLSVNQKIGQFEFRDRMPAQ